MKETIIKKVFPLPQISVVFNLGNGRSVGGNTGPEVGAFLRDGAGDGRALHFSLVVDDDTGVVLEVEEGTVSSSERLRLSDNNGGVHLKTYVLKLTIRGKFASLTLGAFEFNKKMLQQNSRSY